MIEEVYPIDLIVSRRMGYLDAEVIKSVTAFAETQEVENLHHAQAQLAKLIEREEFKHQQQADYEKRAGYYGEHTD
jgi:hypothetical protein